MPNVIGESKTPITSSERKSVFLHEWWLIKVNRESKLGVGGFVHRGTLQTRGMRLFSSASTGKRHNINTTEDRTQVYGSAAIVKRHDDNTVEAIDGIIIRISGCINKSRTLSYGFSPEVCDAFFSGFPCGWEDYAFKSSHDRCDNTTRQPLPVSFDDLPVTQVRDLLISETDSRALTSIIFRDILKHTEKCLNQNVLSTEKISMDSRETEAVCKQDDDVSLSTPTQKITEEDHKIPIDSHSEKAEDGGFMSDEMHKMTQQKQSKVRRYPLRSTRKRKNT